MIHYPVELRISFENGIGTTRSVSREEVRFATKVPLAVGERLTGTLRSAPEGDGTSTTLRYSARVIGVRQPDEHGLVEVEARFEHIGFAILQAPEWQGASRADLFSDAKERPCVS